MVKPAAQPSLGLGARIRRRRQAMSMTLHRLGAASGVSAGYLSQVERDLAVPTLGTLAGIAAALDVGIDHFIAASRQGDHVTRAASRPKFSLAGNSILYEQIGAECAGHELTSFILNMPPGYRSETVQHEGEELIYVLEGEVSQVVDGQAFLLRAGDSMHYLGEYPHSWSNPSQLPARLLWTGKMLHSASTSRRIGAAGLPGLNGAEIGAPDGGGHDLSFGDQCGITQKGGLGPQSKADDRT